jgi:Flp pilus assembly protein protease CpaA
MRMALICFVSIGVAVASGVVLADTYSWWESALVGLFCGLPVFLLGSVWAERRYA